MGQTIFTAATQFCSYSMKSAEDNTKMNERGYVPITLYLWMLNFKFHMVFHLPWNILLLTPLPQLFENVKPILSSQDVHIKAMGHIWLLGHGLPSLASILLVDNVLPGLCPNSSSSFKFFSEASPRTPQFYVGYPFSIFRCSPGSWTSLVFALTTQYYNNW